MPKYYLAPKAMIDRVSWAQVPVWLLEAGAFYLLLGIARLLPYTVASAVFARGLGFVGYRNQTKRRVVSRNMRIVLPDATEQSRDEAVRQVFRATGRAAIELFLLERLWRTRARRLEFALHPQAEALLAAKAPVVFASAHVGGWQLAPLLGRKYDFAVSVLYAPESNPWLNRFFIGRRRAFDASLVPSQGGARDFMRELAAGRSVGAAFDTRVDEGEMIPFFGVATPTTTMPALLSLRGYPLVPTRVLRLPGCRYRIEVMAPLAPTDPSAPRAAQVSDLTEQLNRVFEDWIREDPGQWVCMKRRWPKVRPAPAPAADV